VIRRSCSKRRSTYFGELNSFDVSPDGKRFLMIEEPDQVASVAQIDIVLNWLEELKRTVPIR
jgi:hypothetical protein